MSENEPQARSSYLGKYREIVLAVALFVALDLGVLALNFITSFQIDQDTVAINLSGRQRYTSQSVARTLLELDAARASGRPYDPATIQELREAAEIFQRTSVAFRDGGVVPGGDGRPVRLDAVTSPRGRELEARVETLWGPYYRLLQPILAAPAFSDAQLRAALAYSQTHNLTLLASANDFVTETQVIGASRASRLRMIQTAGILLALLNFAFILFKFVRRLRDNDRKIEAAQKETTEILATVKEGLFLLDARFRVGSQVSASLPQILGRALAPGSDFRELLRAMVAPRVFASACDYIELLFGDRVRESLVQELNPLHAIAVTTPGLTGAPQRRYLTLQFSRVTVNGRISHLLVTVIDVSAQIELERTLDEVRKRSRSEIGVVLDLLKIHPATLTRFLDTAERVLIEVNDRLRALSGNADDARHAFASIFRRVHTLKGEAAVLGLELFENLAQRFETVLAALRDKNSANGIDLLTLPLPLDESLQRVALVRDLAGQLVTYREAYTPAADDAAFVQNLDALARRIARDHGKDVQLVAELDLMGSLPQSVKGEIKDIAVQLVRNAVVHGIEVPAQRVGQAKLAAGTVYVGLRPVGDGEYEFVLRDDGRGLVPARIREALRCAGRYSETELAQFSDRQIVMKIFDAGFTTVAQAGRDAGHGVGMDVVKKKTERLGAHLRVTTRENIFTQFNIRFAT